MKTIQSLVILFILLLTACAPAPVAIPPTELPTMIVIYVAPLRSGKQPEQGQEDLQDYENTKYGFHLRYSNLGSLQSIDDSHIRIEFYVFPFTNLIEKSVQISASRNTSGCPATYGGRNLLEKVTIGQNPFVHEAGYYSLGSRHYDWDSYNTAHNNICINMTLLLRSGPDAGSTTPMVAFNRQDEEMDFQSILSSFSWTTH